VRELHGVSLAMQRVPTFNHRANVDSCQQRCMMRSDWRARERAVVHEMKSSALAPQQLSASDEFAISSGEVVSRRRFLGNLVFSGLGTGALLSGATALGALATPESASAAGLTRQGFRLGPDGLPYRSVAGTFIAAGGDRILLAADLPTVALPPAGAASAVVNISLMPSTAIAGVSGEVYGDPSMCRRGDRLNVGTHWAPDGTTRIAEYIEVNMLAGMASLTSIGNNEISYTLAYADGSSDEYVGVTDAQTRFDLLDGGTGGLDDFVAGQYVHVVAYCDGPNVYSGMQSRIRVMAQAGGGTSW